MPASINMTRSGERRIQVSITGTYTAASEVASSGPAAPYIAATLAARQADALDTQGASLAAGVLTINAGFKPSFVQAVNVTERIGHEWHAGMNQGDYLKTLAAGTRSLETDDALVANLATGVVTVLATGDVLDDNDTIVVVIEG